MLEKKTKGPAAPSANEVLEKKHPHEDQHDASDMDGDTFESESNASETEIEASISKNDESSVDDSPSTNGHASPQKSSKGPETDNIASNNDISEKSDLEMRTFVKLLKIETHRKLVAACICDNHLLVGEAINALDTKNTASEEVKWLLHEMTLLAARLGHFSVLDTLLAYMKDHLSDPDDIIDELVVARFTPTERLEIVNILFANKFDIGCNPEDKRSKLERLIMGPD